MDELEITRVENGFVIHQGAGYDGRMGMERKRWVVRTPRELGELVEKLVSQGPEEKAKGE